MKASLRHNVWKTQQIVLHSVIQSDVEVITTKILTEVFH